MDTLTAVSASKTGGISKTAVNFSSLLALYDQA